MSEQSFDFLRSRLECVMFQDQRLPNRFGYFSKFFMNGLASLFKMCVLVEVGSGRAGGKGEGSPIILDLRF